MHCRFCSYNFDTSNTGSSDFAAILIHISDVPGFPRNPWNRYPHDEIGEGGQMQDRPQGGGNGQMQGRPESGITGNGQSDLPEMPRGQDNVKSDSTKTDSDKTRQKARQSTI